MWRREERIWGCTKNRRKIWLKNFDDPLDTTPWKYVITHELFHVLGIRARPLSNAYKASYTRYDIGRGCYKGSPGTSVFVIKTYDFNTRDPSESFAESGTLYVLGGKRGLPNFQAQCPDNYNFWLQAIGSPVELPAESQPPPEGTGETVTVEVRKGIITTTYRSSNTCNGTYDLSNTHKFPIGNFGDPNCDFSKDALNDLIKRLDPGRFCGKSGKCYDRLDVWNGIIRCESGYRPNAINRQIGRTGGSGWGAWGLFQMNPDFAGRARHDNGTVDWRTKAENAIIRNNNVSDGGFGYWSCARGFRRGTK